jgi:hypothetical protein
VPASIIKPKGSVFKPQQMERAIQNTLTGVAKDIKVDFGVVTQTWQHRPDFKITSPDQYTREIATDDEVFGMLNVGTRAHEIRPKKARGILRFITPFQSKTLPNQIMSRAGSKGQNKVVARVVHHPGTAARNWNKVIAQKWQAQVGAIFQRALDAENK